MRGLEPRLYYGVNRSTTVQNRAGTALVPRYNRVQPRDFLSYRAELFFFDKKD